jgi:hypothetical protein
MNKSIFSQLPNDIIMKIIRETKSSLDYKRDHEDEWCVIMGTIENVGEEYSEEWERVRDGHIIYVGVLSDQFFCGLYHNDDLTDTIVKYRRNRPSY